MFGWTRSEYIEFAGIILTALVAFVIFLLQSRLTDKQRIDNRAELENRIGSKLYDIHYKDHSGKIQLYNSKLIGKTYFAENKRSFFWGYPFHGAELYEANFDGLEFVVGIEKWNNKKYYKVGVIPYERVLGVKPDGDGSFNGMIFYVKPRIFQLDRYSIAFTKFRYYEVENKNARSKK